MSVEEPLSLGSLNMDCLYLVLSYLPVRDKFRCERVCRSWQQILLRLYPLQTSLGTEVWAFECSALKHWVTCNDVVPLNVFTPTFFPSVMGKCCNIRAVIISLPDESTDGVEEDANDAYIHLLMNDMKEEEAEVELNEETLRLIATHCPRLECLGSLEYFEETREGLLAEAWQFVAQKCGQTLRHLRAKFMKEETLKYLIERCPRLIELDITGDITGHCLSLVSKDFESLDLSGSEMFGSEGLQALLSVPGINLSKLYLSDISGDMFQVICRRIVNLKELKFEFSVGDIPDPCQELKKVKAFKKLEMLQIHANTGIKIMFDDTFTEIASSCPLLQAIYIHGLLISDRSLKYLSHSCPDLEKLEISGHHFSRKASLTDEALKSIAKLPKLQFLRIDLPNGITEKGIVSALRTCPKLITLIAYKCQLVSTTRTFFDTCLTLAKSKPNESFQIYIMNSKDKLSNLIHTPREESIPGNLKISLKFASREWSCG